MILVNNNTLCGISNDTLQLCKYKERGTNATINIGYNNVIQLHIYSEKSIQKKKYNIINKQHDYNYYKPSSLETLKRSLSGSWTYPSLADSERQRPCLLNILSGIPLTADAVAPPDRKL